MKKLLLLLSIAALSAISANAQSFEKGDWYLNAQLSDIELSHAFYRETNVNGTNFRIATNVGYFVANKFAVDVMLGFNYYKLNYLPSSTLFTFDVGASCYPVGNWFARLGYGGTKGKSSSVSDYLTVSVGYDLFVFPNVFFEPGVYYHESFVSGVADDFGLMLGIGVKF